VAASLGILQIPTLYSSLQDALAAVPAHIGFPCVIKSCSGAGGEGVWKAVDSESLAEVLALPDIKDKYAMLFQPLLECGGRDVRVVFIGGQYAYALSRQGGPDAWKSNMSKGTSHFIRRMCFCDN
jgi:glutathione synthase/RimK-type ligase-like ATP-grasp enzyme